MHHPHITPSTSDTATTDRWSRLLDDIRAAAHADGVNAGEWWTQNTIGGRASGVVTALARATLDGIDAGDPMILDALPHPADDSPARTYRNLAGLDLPTWAALSPHRRAVVSDAYRAAFDEGLSDQVCAACAAVLEPADDDPATPVVGVQEGH